MSLEEIPAAFGGDNLMVMHRHNIYLLHTPDSRVISEEIVRSNSEGSESLSGRI